MSGLMVSGKPDELTFIASTIRGVALEVESDVP